MSDTKVIVISVSIVAIVLIIALTETPGRGNLKIFEEFETSIELNVAPDEETNTE